MTDEQFFKEAKELLLRIENITNDIDPDYPSKGKLYWVAADMKTTSSELDNLCDNYESERE